MSLILCSELFIDIYSHALVLQTKPWIFPVCPPVVAVPWGATIIQPSVVKTESDVMKTIKLLLLTFDAMRQFPCHAEAKHKPWHMLPKGLFCYIVRKKIHTAEELHSTTNYCYCCTWKHMKPPANSRLLWDTLQKTWKLCRVQISFQTKQQQIKIASATLSLSSTSMLFNNNKMQIGMGFFVFFFKKSLTFGEGWDCFMQGGKKLTNNGTLINGAILIIVASTSLLRET